MDISELTLKLIILLIPGIISANIYGKLTIRSKPKSDFMFVLTAIVFGIISYLLLQIAYLVPTFYKNVVACHPLQYPTLKTFKDLSGSNSIPYFEVLLASLLSVIVGFLASNVDNKKYLNRLGTFLNLTRKYGDENLYMKFLNSPDIDYVYVRDIGNNLTYFGYIDSYSETTDFKELVLGDVKVYNYPDSEFMYEIERIYLCLPVNNVIFELANNKNNGTEA